MEWCAQDLGAVFLWRKHRANGCETKAKKEKETLSAKVSVVLFSDPGCRVGL
jgi:hypothetical protein